MFIGYVEGQMTDRCGHLIKKSEYLAIQIQRNTISNSYLNCYLQSLIISSCVFILIYICMTCQLFWRRNSESSALGYKIQIQFGVPKYVKKNPNCSILQSILFSIRKSALILITVQTYKYTLFTGTRHDLFVSLV